MRLINEENDLFKISGGVNVSGSIINAFAKGIESLLNVGRSLGTAIRRLYNGNLCSI